MPEMSEEMQQEEGQELQGLGDLSQKLQSAKDLISSGDTDQAMSVLDECITHVGGMQGQEEAHAEGEPAEKEGKPEQVDFKEALNKAFK